MIAVALSAMLMAISLVSDEIEVKVMAGVFSATIFMACLACAPKPPDEDK